MKKNKIKNIANKFYLQERIIVTISLIVAAISMSIGYALYQSDLELEGLVALEKAGILEISKMETITTNYVRVGDYNFENVNTDTGRSLKSHFIATFSNNSANKLSFRYMIENNTKEKYTYIGNDFYYLAMKPNSDFDFYSPSIEGLNVGDVLEPGDKAEVIVSYVFTDIVSGVNSYSADVNFNLNFGLGAISIIPPKVLGSVSNNKLEFDVNYQSNVNVSIISMLDTSVDYSVSLSNSSLSLVNNGGNPATYSGKLNAGKEKNFTIHIKLKAGVEYHNPLTTKVFITLSNGNVIDAGTITLSKKEDVVPSIENIELIYSFEPVAGWENHYTLYIEIINKNEFTIDEWNLYLKLDEKITLSDVQNWSDSLTYDADNNILNLTSLYLYADTHYTLAPGDSHKTGQTILVSNINEFNVMPTIDVFYNGTWHNGLAIK